MRFRPRFSLRTLLIVVTVIGAWLGPHLLQVQERNAALRSCHNVAIIQGPRKAELPWLSLKFGATPISRIFVDEDAPEDSYRRLERAFPEAELRRENLERRFGPP